MTQLWTVHGLPEVRRVPAPQRGELVRSSLHWAPASLRLLALTALGMALLPALAGLAGMLDMLRPRVAPPTLLAAGVLYAAAASLVGHQAYTRIVRAMVRSFLRAHWRNERLSVCLHCGYDLRASDGAACPECGAASPREASHYHLRRAA
jgi:hypothetical protein